MPVAVAQGRYLLDPRSFAKLLNLAQVTATDRVLAFHQDIGLSAERLGARACREAEPLLAPGISGGVDLPDDHQVDNRSAALSDGAEFFIARRIEARLTGRPNLAHLR